MSESVSSPLAALKNYCAITDDIGTSGQPTRAQFALIRDAGYQSVINLAMPDSDHAIADEGSIVTSLGMRFVHIPVRFDAPTEADLRAFVGVLHGLSGGRTWVHCVVNARVSAFVYLYLKHVRGLPEADSRTPLLDQWEPQMDSVWKTFIAEGGTRLG